MISITSFNEEKSSFIKTFVRNDTFHVEKANNAWHRLEPSCCILSGYYFSCSALLRTLLPWQRMVTYLVTMATDGYLPCYQSKDMTKVEQDINGKLVLELKRNIGNDPPTRWIIWESSAGAGVRGTFTRS